MGSLSPSLIIMPATMAVRPTMEPTERSMPPVRITKVMPMPRMALMATCLAMISMLATARKFGAITAKMMVTRIRTMNARAFSSNCWMSVPVMELRLVRAAADWLMGCLPL